MEMQRADSESTVLSSGLSSSGLTCHQDNLVGGDSNSSFFLPPALASIDALGAGHGGASESPPCVAVRLRDSEDEAVGGGAVERSVTGTLEDSPSLSRSSATAHSASFCRAHGHPHGPLLSPHQRLSLGTAAHPPPIAPPPPLPSPPSSAGDAVVSVRPKLKGHPCAVAVVGHGQRTGRPDAVETTCVTLLLLLSATLLGFNTLVHVAPRVVRAAAGQAAIDHSNLISLVGLAACGGILAALLRRRTTRLHAAALRTLGATAGVLATTPRRRQRAEDELSDRSARSRASTRRSARHRRAVAVASSVASISGVLHLESPPL